MAENNTLEIDIDGFPMIGGENILTPAESAIFKRAEDETFSFSEPAKTPTNPTGSVVEETSTKDAQDNLLNELTLATKTEEEIAEIDPKTNERPAATGKAKTDKSALVEFVKAKIEAKEYVTFDDYDEAAPIDDYLLGLSNKDLNSLIDENQKLTIDKVKQEVPQQFYEMLPEDFKIAYEYISNGGKDLKGLYRALGEIQQLKDLDPTVEGDQEEIVYEYFRNANPDWTSDEIKEEVETIKDNALLAKKANQLKPKLDKMKEQIVQYRLQEQSEIAKQKQEAANTYITNVYETLKPGEINGVKLDPKTQALLYNGLTKAEYQSMSGGNTNLLGHLLEKYQYGKDKNYGLISEALWLLQDPENYRNALIQKGVNKNTEETVKKLKTEQGNRSSSVAFEDSGNASRVVKQSSNKISRNSSPFSR